MRRALIWLHVLLGWLPVWALYSALIIVVHGPASPLHAMLIAARAILSAAALGVLVHRLARRVPWPHPFRAWFVLLHVAAAPTYAVSWLLLVSLVESAVRRQLVFVVGPGFLPFFVLGVWLYVMVAGISYAIEATERAARAEATAARTQLAALRAQLHPHFLFNALHTVVQLIPMDPARAQDAAEQVAALLRTTVEEDRDLVSLADEWAFVSRYLEIERLRFGDRLRVHASLDGDAMSAAVPSFALQTLVENAVRHGAAPRVEATDVFVSVRGDGDVVTITVRDTGTEAAAGGTAQGTAGEAPSSTGTVSGNGSGTGLVRLRERLAALYGGASRLELATSPGGGWTATLVIPRDARDDA